jgi:pilus assembly protein CpaB
VVVAARNIPGGTVITKEVLGKRDYHKDFVPKNAILMEDYTRILGMKTTADVATGEPLLTAHFEEGAASSLAPKLLAAMVLPGERAVTIMVDEETGVAGLLRPGDYVDVLGSFVRPADQKLATITLLQNMPVLAAGSLVGATQREPGQDRSARGYRTVTLSATLEESELLIFAQQRTKLALVLRNPEDSETLDKLPEVNFDNIFQPEVRKQIQARRNQINQNRIKIIQ